MNKQNAREDDPIQSVARSSKILTLIFLSGLFSASCAQSCPTPPPPIRDLNIARYYADPAGTEIDTTKKAQHERDVRTLRIYVGQLAELSDHAVATGRLDTNASEARCAVSWLAYWASARALLGSMASKQAEYQRKWDLAGIALVYLKVRKAASPQERERIEPWLRELAHAARRFFDTPNHKRNNHWYWLGLSMGATALATDDGNLWQQARGIMEDAANDIADNGTLPYELARGHLALKYHAFSVMPLIVLAELAAFTKGENWYALNDGALHRLARTTLKALENPSDFAKIAGTLQSLPVSPGAGWIVLYRDRFANSPQLPAHLIKRRHRWLGGDVRNLRLVLQTLKNER